MITIIKTSINNKSQCQIKQILQYYFIPLEQIKESKKISQFNFKQYGYYIYNQLQYHKNSIIYWICQQYPRILIPILYKCYKCYKLLLLNGIRSKVYYRDNFARLYGGAQILMLSSKNIKSANSILQDNLDQYMHTDQPMPIKFIIGLQQEIAIDSITIHSRQMFSSIICQFHLEGSFTLLNPKWASIGIFRAENNFNQQIFMTQNKFIRYVRITILSTYGKWTYFTLTQVKIYGRSLFAHAVSDEIQLNEEQKNKKKQKELQQINNIHHEQKLIIQQQQQKILPKNQLPHDSNLVVKLLNKINNLQQQHIKSIQNIITMNYKLQKLQMNLLNNQNKIIITPNYYIYILALVMITIIMLLATVLACLLVKNQPKQKIKKCESSRILR